MRTLKIKMGHIYYVQWEGAGRRGVAAVHNKIEDIFRIEKKCQGSSIIYKIIPLAASDGDLNWSSLYKDTLDSAVEFKEILIEELPLYTYLKLGPEFFKYFKKEMS